MAIELTGTLPITGLGHGTPGEKSYPTIVAYTDPSAES